MKISDLFSRLEKSKAFRDFKKSKETKKAFFCTGFFILNFKQAIFEYSLDFRNEKELFAFKIPIDENEGIILTQDKLLENPKPMPRVDEAQAKNVNPDIEDLKDIVEKEMAKNKITSPLDEIIAVLQNSDESKQLVWHLTCIVAGFTILNVIIDAKSGDLLKFEKKNLLDFASVKKNDKK